MSRPVLDYANLTSVRLGAAGIDPSRLTGDLAARFREAYVAVETRRASGGIGFFDLPRDEIALAAVRHVVEEVRHGVTDVVVLGIGGSGLGATTLRDALGGIDWNADSRRRGGRPRLHVLDNPDPETVRGVFARLDPATTLFDVVSKSGSTAETMALYLYARAWIESSLGPEGIADAFVFTTDPARGVLRRIADAEGIRTLDVPPNVGGRFSVMSPVGLFPAAMMGADAAGLLAGASDMLDACTTDQLRENPAGLLATLLHEADTAMGRGIHVVMPYADRLRSFTLWYQQLWAESLGKVRADGPVGPTPLPAVGATDQHAQVQLFMEGPHDKVVIFVETPRATQPVKIPPLHGEEDALAYLGGASLADLLDVERRATTEALRQGGRPSATIRMPAIDARSLGGLFMLWQIATVYAGALYGVDPLDQPGVELGKVLTYGLMGRDGYDQPEFPPPEPEFVC